MWNLCCCWYDDICVIAEDDPVRTLWLAFGHTTYNCQYSIRGAVCIVRYSVVQLPDNSNRLHICHGNWTSRNPESTQVLWCYCGLVWFGVIWHDFSNAMTIWQLKISAASKFFKFSFHYFATFPNIYLSRVTKYCSALFLLEKFDQTTKTVKLDTSLRLE